MKEMLLFLSTCIMVTRTIAQQYQGDWDTYIMEVDQRPVSVMVDLDFVNAPEAKTKKNVMIVRVILKQPLRDGMPGKNEMRSLDSIENNLVNGLSSSLSAQYAGRFTQQGKRDYYFYSNDTSDCKMHITTALQSFPLYRWTILVKADPDFSNYFNVLYPTSEELERIKNRRMVEALQEKGDQLTAPRTVSHLIFFRTEAGRKSFAGVVQDSGYVVEKADKEIGVKDYPYSLQISRTDKIDFNSINKVSLFLWKLALHYSGKYDGWETFVVK